MNLVDFYVAKILEEKRGLAYELYGMTKEQAEAEEAEYPFWHGALFLPAVKQTYEYDCYGRITVDTKVFLANESPYYVGYKGVC